VPLVATEVKQTVNGRQDVEVQAPLQSFDPLAQTITVLGLTIDASGIVMEGADDDSRDGHHQEVAFDHLMAGQSVEVVLVASSPPLIASEIEVKNFANQLGLELIDSHGRRVEDLDALGNEMDDVRVDVLQFLRVQGRGGGAGSTLEPKVLHFHARSNGTVTVTGLATGSTWITVARTHGGRTASAYRGLRVNGDTLRFLRLRLRGLRTAGDGAAPVAKDGLRGVTTSLTVAREEFRKVYSHAPFSVVCWTTRQAQTEARIRKPGFWTTITAGMVGRSGVRRRLQ
jgi:hypothetical protein